MQNFHQEIWPTVIIGAGASGLFCAGSFSGRKLVLEHNDIVGKKLSITGGGKCNFTNLFLTPQDYISQHKHFCKNALSSFPAVRFTTLLEQAHIPFYEKEQGQLFAHDAQEIVRFLKNRAAQNNTVFSCSTQVLGVTKENSLFRIQTSKGLFWAQRVVVATGGISYPALGASPLAFQIAKTHNIPVTDLRPALVALRVEKSHALRSRQLAGNSLPVEVKIQKHTEYGQLLFTHDGFSGPAILQSSLFWKEGEKIIINFLPNLNIEEFLKEHKNQKQFFSKILTSYISPKIAKVWLGELDVMACDAKKETLRLAAQRLNRFECIPTATAGYTRAEVTAGGIDCSQINPSTMESKNVSGLFFIGEALDVTGRVGGYNLHWAWASAYACAQRLRQV